MICTLQERCRSAAALTEQHRLAHAGQGEVTRAVQARLDALTGAHLDLKTVHDALQAKHNTLHHDLKIAHDALQHQDLLLRHAPLQAKL